jgi:hypothetical protein
MKQGGKQPLLCFLYIYFMNNPNSTLCTEYNEVPQLTQTHQATNMTSMSMHNLFCADLDFIEVSVPGSAATGGKAITQEQDDFMLLPPPSDKEDGESDDNRSLQGSMMKLLPRKSRISLTGTNRVEIEMEPQNCPIS